MSSTNDPLPEGLSIHSRDESLETAHSNAGEARLLAAADGLELVRGTLAKGHRLHLYPSEDPGYEATEIYVLLHGSLSCQSADCVKTLGPGDYFIARGLRQAAVFSALTDIEFLYVSSRPSFGEISASLRSLRDLTREIATKDAGETEEHCRRMRSLSYGMGRTLALPQHRLHLLDYAAYFHDVGKLEVPAEVLQKPGPLTPAEWSLIRKHPASGRHLLEPTFMKMAGPIVEQHHERYDGSGYPYGLQGDAICTEAYIIAVADSYDAMTSNRPYRPALTREAAISEVMRYAGQHYPAAVVQALLENLEALEG